MIFWHWESHGLVEVCVRYSNNNFLEIIWLWCLKIMIQEWGKNDCCSDFKFRQDIDPKLVQWTKYGYRDKNKWDHFYHLSTYFMDWENIKDGSKKKWTWSDYSILHTPMWNSFKISSFWFSLYSVTNQKYAQQLQGGNEAHCWRWRKIQKWFKNLAWTLTTINKIHKISGVNNLEAYYRWISSVAVSKYFVQCLHLFFQLICHTHSVGLELTTSLSPILKGGGSVTWARAHWLYSI